MIKIDKSFSLLLKERFNSCFDAVVQKIEITYDDGARYPNVFLEIETMDDLSDDEWSILKMRLNEVEAMCFVEGQATYRILSDGVSLQFTGECFEMNFEDIEISKSHLFFTFKEGSWSI